MLVCIYTTFSFVSYVEFVNLIVCAFIYIDEWGTGLVISHLISTGIPPKSHSMSTHSPPKSDWLPTRSTQESHSLPIGGPLATHWGPTRSHKPHRCPTRPPLDPHSHTTKIPLVSHWKSCSNPTWGRCGLSRTGPSWNPVRAPHGPCVVRVSWMRVNSQFKQTNKLYKQKHIVSGFFIHVLFLFHITKGRLWPNHTHHHHHRCQPPCLFSLDRLLFLSFSFWS